MSNAMVAHRGFYAARGSRVVRNGGAERGTIAASWVCARTLAATKCNNAEASMAATDHNYRHWRQGTTKQ